MSVERRTRNKAEKLKKLEFIKNILLLADMLGDAGKGKYRLSRSTVATTTFALIYFLLPLDAIIDYIPLLGYLDDATVVAIVMKVIKGEINNYISWKKSSQP